MRIEVKVTAYHTAPRHGQKKSHQKSRKVRPCEEYTTRPRRSLSFSAFLLSLSRTYVRGSFVHRRRLGITQRDVAPARTRRRMCLGCRLLECQGHWRRYASPACDAISDVGRARARRVSRRTAATIQIGTLNDRRIQSMRKERTYVTKHNTTLSLSLYFSYASPFISLSFLSRCSPDETDELTTEKRSLARRVY